ncbi:hypothetical protein GR7B_00002 [Vibrio phage vB_VcorM_GR7B]|nr:hypothetical protein GR7B_00002 [Vibrio phage vB_VcorM_GR7B]
MFDANAAHIRCGDLFFAEVHATSPVLEAWGVKKNTVILCQHIRKEGYRNRDNVETNIWVSLDKGYFAYNAKADGDFAWLVYSGRPNGEGFLDNKQGQGYKGLALDFLNGEWTGQGTKVVYEHRPLYSIAPYRVVQLGRSEFILKVGNNTHASGFTTAKATTEYALSVVRGNVESPCARRPHIYGEEQCVNPK